MTTLPFTDEGIVRYYLCPLCKGRGQRLSFSALAVEYHGSYQLCDDCNGIGYVPEEDYLVMKLAGKV